MRPVIMIMGIMASGKSRIGREIADRLGFIFVEGDDFHPASNVQKMSAGEPLTDTDRAPWLQRLATEVNHMSAKGDGVVFSCSALKRAYRDKLKQTLPELLTICLDLDADTAIARASARSDHFMPSVLVDSQLATLERPVAESRSRLIDANAAFAQVLENAQAAVDEWLKMRA